MTRSFTANILSKGLHRFHVAEGLLAAIDPLGPISEDLPYCTPGFVDLQINGWRGVNFGAPDLTPEAIAGILAPIQSSGVTSFCPTVITDTPEGLARSFHILERARQIYPAFAKAAPCYHLEGPYLSKGGSRGAHDPGRMRPPDWEEFRRLQSAANGRIGIVTIAPELPGAIDFIRRAAAANVVVALGHTDCTPEDIDAAVQAGATLSTHLGNGSPEYIHRHRAPIWAQLAADRLSASIICDGFHLPREVVRTIVRAKGPERTILVTDATHIAGLAPARYTLGSMPVELLPDGRIVTFTSPPCLGGSTLRMDDAITRFANWSGLPLEAALQTATGNPARLLPPVCSVCRELSPGNPANLTLWRWRDATLRVQAVLIDGDWVQTDSSTTL